MPFQIDEINDRIEDDDVDDINDKSHLWWQKYKNLREKEDSVPNCQALLKNTKEDLPTTIITMIIKQQQQW